MLRHITVFSLALILMLGSPLTRPASAQQKQNRLANAFAIPVVGAVTGAVTGTFNGTATITRFARNNGQLVATGMVTGTVTNAAGQVVQSLAATFTAPVTAAAQSGCEILGLILGPLQLNLLGLGIDLNQVMLYITAIPGAGNLLGNLLCSVAGLLDGGGSLRQIVNQLNDILSML
jgi:hypothetical protein